jgi:hypothetical protein
MRGKFDNSILGLSNPMSGGDEIIEFQMSGKALKSL